MMMKTAASVRVSELEDEEYELVAPVLVSVHRIVLEYATRRLRPTKPRSG
jgi:hypothetical protein